MTDLISREALLAAYTDLPYVDEAIVELIAGQAAVVPQVVANISGGILQGASSDYPVDLYALDFDVDSFDDDATGIEVEGSNAYLHQTRTVIDPAFVTEVKEAPEINFSTGEEVDDGD